MFLCSYFTSVCNVQLLTTEQILKGKTPVHALVQPKNVKVRPPDPPWSPPPAGWMALSVDGSFSAADRSAGAGMILRDERGAVIFASCQLLFYCNNALEAEIQALRIGMSLALQWSSLPVLVQSDSVEALSSMLDGSLNKSPFGHLVKEIKFHMLEREFKSVKIARSQNKVSHCLANYARTAHSTACWLQRPRASPLCP